MLGDPSADMSSTLVSERQYHDARAVQHRRRGKNFPEFGRFRREINGDGHG
jgi:hypothetical protein